MTVRRLVSLLSVCTIATTTAVVAQPKKAPVAPAKDAPAVPLPDAGSGSGSAQPEEEPPKDIEGRDENPGNPNGIGDAEPTKIVTPAKKKQAGYPVEEYLRPINLPQNMTEASIGPHAQLGAGDDTRYAGGDSLRLRYGITREVQLGLTYVFAGVYDDPATMPSTKLGFHSGKAVGLDLTVLVKNWMGIRVGVPFYLKPVATSLQIGVPMKFQLGDKYAIGGLDDLLNIKLYRFPVTFYQEAVNANNAELDDKNSIVSKGALRVSVFGVYQHKPKVAFIGRTGFNMEDFATTRTGTDAPDGGLTYFLRAQVNWTPRPFLDLGASLGFDDLGHVGSFGPSGYLAFRI